MDPSKVRFCSAFKLVPVPPVITLLSALLLIVAEPDEPCSPFWPLVELSAPGSPFWPLVVVPTSPFWPFVELSSPFWPFCPFTEVPSSPSTPFCPFSPFVPVSPFVPLTPGDAGCFQASPFQKNVTPLDVKVSFVLGL